MMKKYFYFLCITILPLCGVWACSNENTESHDEFGNQGENIPTAIKKLDYGQLLAFPGAEGHIRNRYTAKRPTSSQPFAASWECRASPRGRSPAGSTSATRKTRCG